MPRVSVIIPTKNRPAELKRMRESLAKQSFKDFEVLVVDGNLISGGLVVQENIGLLMAKGDIFIRTDDDAEVPPNWLEEIVDVFDNNPNAGGVTCPTVTSNPANRDLFLFQNRLRNGNLFWRIVGKVYYDYILEGRVDAVGKVMRSGAFTLGSNMTPVSTALQEIDVHDCCTLACRTKLLRKIGGFDETYNGVGDLNEPDVSFRIRKAGFKILFTPRTFAIHHASRNGVYGARLNPWPRLRNFLIFHRRYFKFNLRFAAYLLFQVGYYAVRRHV